MQTIKRKSCRGIFITPEDRVLLMKIGNSTSDWSGWITPGGGIEENEEEVAAFRREIEEELGITNFDLLRKVWKRLHCFSWKGNIIEQSEVFFLIKIGHFHPRPKMPLEETELIDFQEFRWWNITDIQNSKDNFAPTNLASELKKLLSDELPVEPVDVGI